MDILKGYNPETVWKYFEEISKIPRCSKHEEKIRAYVKSVAENLGLKYKEDDVGNIVVMVDGKGSYERDGVVLQAHLDMVCEKNSDVKHDFSTDPLKLRIEGDWLKATGTTLGADNGIGIAILLAMMEENDSSYPPMEMLFTVDEETGMTGAFNLKSDFVRSRKFINVDSEDNAIYIGCAGGGDSRITMSDIPVEEVKGTPYKLVINGLKGGHSGTDITLERANAIILLSRALSFISDNGELNIMEFSGGDKHNAIPREAFAVFSTSIDEGAVKDIILKATDAFKEEYSSVEPTLNVTLESLDKNDVGLNTYESERFINFILSMPHGVARMSPDIEDLAETSCNLAKVNLNGSELEVLESSRSSVRPALDALRRKIKAVSYLYGAEVKEGSPYPGWKPNLKSPLLAIASDVYAEMNGKKPEVKAIHAGLEAGILAEKYPGSDIISIGPLIEFPHSPDERLNIKSVEYIYSFLKNILKALSV